MVVYSASLIRRGKFGIPALLYISPVFLGVVVFAVRHLGIDHAEVPVWLNVVSVLFSILLIPLVFAMWLYFYNLLMNRYQKIRAKYNKSNNHRKRGS